MPHTILMSNLGYARGINGALDSHVRHAHRHIYCSLPVQRDVLRQLSDIIATENPDLCCFVEIDKGSGGAKAFNQMDALINDAYPFFDIENKYRLKSIWRSVAFTRGKSNAFIAKRNYTFEKLYFSHGVKRLVYKIQVEQNLTVFFAHFSLQQRVRTQQLQEVAQLMNGTPGEVAFLGDFNILTGLSELKPLLAHGHVLLNRDDVHTFHFHKRKLVLDLCICSASLAERATLKIIPQPYSDHAALLLTINDSEMAI